MLVACTLIGCSAPKAKDDNTTAQTTKVIINEVDVAQINSDSVKYICFGRVKEGEVPFYKFSFRNTTETPIVVVSCETSCGCIVVDYPTKPIAVNEVGECRMKLYSTMQYGRRSYDVNFELSSGKRYNVLIEAEIE